MIFNFKQKIRNVLKWAFSFIFIFLISLSTSYTKESIVDASIATYVANNAKPNKYIHSKILRAQDENLVEYNQATNKYLNSLKTDFNTFSSYITFENQNGNTFNLSNKEFDIEFQTKVMNLNFRFDVNRTFLETIRLRQYRLNVESRHVADNYDFSFYISSFMADKIISQSNGTFFNYDQLLDFDKSGLNFSLDVDGSIKKGHISNIYYIEDENLISISLYEYLQDFIIFYGKKTDVFPNYDQVLNYDFLLTEISLKNNLKFLSQIEFGALSLRDTSNNHDSLTLSNLLDTINNSHANNAFRYLWILLLLVCFFSKILYPLYIKKPLFSKVNFINITILLNCLFLYYFLLKILSLINETLYFTNLLSNALFGTVTISLFCLGGLYYYGHYQALIRVKNEEKKNYDKTF